MRKAFAPRRPERTYQAGAEVWNVRPQACLAWLALAMVESPGVANEIEVARVTGRRFW